MASKETENLSALRESAALSGVHLTVVGLGEPYADYSAKVHRYNEYLQRMVPRADLQAGDAVTVTEDDVIVLIDAYDVLLLPAVRTAGKVCDRTRSDETTRLAVLPQLSPLGPLHIPLSSLCPRDFFLLETKYSRLQQKNYFSVSL